MTKKFFRLSIALLLVFSIAACKKEGKITFEVKDDKSVAVAGAKIKIDATELTTDNNGIAEIELAEGTYKYYVEKEGFGTYSGNVVVTKDGVTEKVKLSESLIGGSFEFNVKDRKKWYYYSFDTGLVGTGSANPADGDDAKWSDRDDWDLAFHNTNVRTNGGTAGKGEAAAIKMSTEKMADVTKAPADGYVVDDTIKIFLAMPPTNPSQDVQHVPGNTEMNGWASFAHSSLVWTIHKNVFVVKTAKGKYVKMQFVDYLDEDDHGGLMKFDYVYQTDGSMNF